MAATTSAQRKSWQDYRQVAVWAAVAALYTALGCHIATLYPKTSDQVAYFNAGIAMAHGHLRLGGWLLTPPDFWTSDIPLSASLSLIWRILGRNQASPLLLALQPALMWTALLASVGFIFRRHGGGLRGGVLIAALLAVPLFAMVPGYFVTLSAIHVGTVIYALWALHFAATSRRLPCFVMLLLGTLGDPLCIIVGALPVILWGIQRHRSMAMVGCGSIALAEALLAINAATGGFTTEKLPLRFAPFDSLTRNIVVTIHDVLTAFGADLSSLPVSSALPELARLGCMLFVAVATLDVIRRRENAPLPVLLVLAAGLDALALMVSDRIELESGSIATVRYLFPLWIDLTLLAAWHVERYVVAPYFAAVALLLSIWSDHATLPARSTGIVSQDDQALIATLMRSAPPNGIGSWWASDALNMSSLGRLHIVPAIAGRTGLMPFVHISPPLQFPGKPFFVLVPHPDETYRKDDAIQQFGAPARQFAIGRYDVLIYEERRSVRDTESP